MSSACIVKSGFRAILPSDEASLFDHAVLVWVNVTRNPVTNAVRKGWPQVSWAARTVIHRDYYGG